MGTKFTMACDYSWQWAELRRVNNGFNVLYLLPWRFWGLESHKVRNELPMECSKCRGSGTDSLAMPVSN